MKKPVSIGIIVRSRKAYLPTRCFEERHKLYFSCEPVLVVDLIFSALVEAVQKKLEEGNPPIEVPNLQWFLKRKKVPPEAKAAGFRSWRSFVKKARSYSINFLEDKTLVTMSGPSKGGWLVADPKKTREFPPDTPLEEVVRVIWEDICSTPELWEEDAP